jgi:RNA polymerase sigma-70 factor (ECF subfamily)
MAKTRIDIEALCVEHGQALVVFLARRTADPEVALDLWAETFARAAADAARYRGHSEPLTWLYSIALCRLADYHRRGHAERRALDRLKLERAPADPGVLAEIERRAGLGVLRSELGTALAQLSPIVREAVELRIVHELPYADIAQRLGATEHTIRVRVSRGLATLGDLLDPLTIREARTT